MRRRIAAAAATALLAMIPYSAARAATPGQDAFSPDAIRAAMRKAADYQFAEQAKTRPDNGWIRAAFYTGVLAAYDATKDETYLTHARQWAGQAGYRINHRDRRFADNLACTQVYTDLYFLDRDASHLADVRAAWDDVVANPRPGRVDWWWCDSLFMGPPGLARLAAATGDAKYLDLLDRQFFSAVDFLHDPDAHLFYRDKSFFPPARTKNGQKIFWSRGNGWVVSGLARVLERYPLDRPNRARYAALLKDTCEQLAKVQPPDGCWRPSLADPDEFPMPETSGTAFFTHAIAWGVNNGLLDRAGYVPVVKRGWEGLLDHLTPEGKLGSVQKVAGAPGAVNPDDTHEYAAGALLLAGAELLKMPGLGK